MWELVKDFANWVGWFPVTVGTVIVMVLGRYFYDRELKFKDTHISKLKDDLEDSKQYRVDVLTQNLTKRVQTLNQELDNLNAEIATEKRQREVIEQDKEKVRRQLETADSEVIKLREELKSYEGTLLATSRSILGVFSSELVLPQETDRVIKSLNKLSKSLYNRNELALIYTVQNEIDEIRSEIQEFRSASCSGSKQTDDERREILSKLQQLFLDLKRL